MAGFVLIICALVVWAFVKLSKSGGPAGAGTVGGIPARGILLWVAAQPSGSTGYSVATKLQQRMAQLDVEIPGQPPYEVTTTISIPLNLVSDVVPGATVELRVSGFNSSNITVVGPGIGIAQGQLPVTTQGGPS